MDRYGRILEQTHKDINRLSVHGDIVKIELYDAKGNVCATTIVNIWHLDKIKSYKWSLSKGYVVGTDNGKQVRLHRLITNAQKDEVVDHINHDPLNNTDANLRVCTNQENAFNQRKKTNSKTKRKGVHWSKDRGKWYSQIMYNGKCIFLGYSDDINVCIAARKAAEEKYFGEFAYQESR
jgi:AP2 domain.